jgi:type VI secretion system protein ImpL
LRLFGYIPIPSPRRLLRARWMRVPLIVIGVLSILAAIWFGLPMTGVDFLSQAWVRAGLIGAILFVIFLTMFLRWNRRRRAAAALEENLVREPVGDARVLSERMREALDKLKKSGGKTYLYDLPWYIIIGPPGAGKTTALKNAGIEFPGSKGQLDAVEGFGGTKNCDWWFAEDAVLIDTAGRYTTQDSDREADEASWKAFLDLLKKGRPNQPINGVILAFSVEDMMRASPGQLDAQAETVRARLAEVHEVLKIDFPVYVLFTKADLIAGFREYFSSFNQSRRKVVWGATFQTRDRSEATHAQVATEFDALVSRLSDEVIDRMSEEPDGISRIAIFGLPGQMALLRDNVVEFLRRVFEPTRYKTNAILRGFYFTSGTQEGNPIDQVLGAMARNQDDGAFTPAFMSGKGKSYFLHDLLKKVIFEESDWVSTDARAVRRAAILRSLGLGTIAVASLGAAGVFGWSFWQNTQLLNRAEAQAAAYFGAAQNEIRREVISDTDPSLVMPHLQDLRMMTAGYGDDREPTLWEGMGLGQHRRVNNAAERAYSDALERMLRPRLILHMENEIPRLIAEGDTAGVYRALKVYILLGGQQGGAPDDAAIQTYFAEVWRGQFASAGQIADRDRLEAHLAAMLELDDTRTPGIAIDPEIVRRAQEVIVNLPLAEQAYASIKDRAATSGVPDFNLVERLSGQVEQVFRTRDGSPLRDVGVPALFTFEGYWGFFLDELTAARQRLQDDQWVLGDAAGRVGYETQLAGLERDLHRLYQGDFVDSWKAMFARIELAPLAADAPGFDVLAAAASPVASPILGLVKAVDEETRLTRLYEQIEGLDAATLASAGLGANLGNAVMNRIYSRSGMFQRVVIDSLRDGEKVQARAGGVEEDSQRRQVERITEQFANWHILLRGAEGQRPVDALLANLAKLRENRRTAAAAPSPTDEQLLQPILSTLTMNNTSLPEPMAQFMNQAEGEFRAVAQNATMAQLNQALTSDVTSVCQQTIEPAFPFGGGRHVAPATFGQFFGPGGAMDRYYSNYLQPHVTRTSAGLQPIAGSPIGDRISRTTLRQFERAEAIRAAFFGSGSPEPQVAMFISHQASSPSVELAVLTINGTEVKTRPNDTPAAAVWPGASTGVMLQLFPQEDGRPNAQQFSDGRWAIVDFLRSGQARVSGNVVTVTHQIGGRSITYRIEFESTTVPFLMPELSDFSCPASLE